MTTATRMTESELIDACLTQDRLAQKMLYEKYSSAMFTLAYRMTNDFELANDALQEAFIKIFRSLHQFRKESTLGAWIKTIVIRTTLGLIKKQMQFDPLPDDTQLQVVNWGTSLDAEYLEKAIQALPHGYRTVFVLIEVEGFAHKEVAELLNISVGTTKSQLFHARKKLKEYLEIMSK
jgi:RNA polymerase sigma-70 factor (ECF subfamily)